MLPKLALSLTGFLPLYLVMIFMYSYVYLCIEQSKNIKNYILCTITIVLIIQIICIIIVNKYIKSKESLRITENEIIFSNIKEDKKAHMDYMMTYLLPLLTFDIDKVDIFYIVYTNIFIIIFVLLNAKSENLNINILLWFKGYSVYTGINNEGEEKVLLIKKKRFYNIRAKHDKYRFVSFGGSNDIYLCKRYIE
ncbi:Hypothetical protein CRIB_233 [Romboutsia ilealis]|uniref:Uncharacterized protein n=1 Tax=Romboutsia ilealis TaxID=1115758 RepID=A0A1V1HYE3_9FIRM|nr:hypothetical protein [Romboutsia ilealis]CED92990.1 Hypothetical protein CRIB_233 [Romboutsia ilealis]